MRVSLHVLKFTIYFVGSGSQLSQVFDLTLLLSETMTNPNRAFCYRYDFGDNIELDFNTESTDYGISLD